MTPQAQAIASLIIYSPLDWERNSPGPPSKKFHCSRWDFVKVYDRVEHVFLWETLVAVGFDHKFISIVRGLMEEGFSKVHFNGMFMMEIPLFRGVRQGFSITHFLFILSTQPFMSLLAKSAAEGELVGLQF